MEDLTIIFYLLSIGLFLARYFVKKSATDYLSAIFAVCTMALVLKDSSIPADQLLIVIIPIFFVLMMSFIRLMLGKKTTDNY